MRRTKPSRCSAVGAGDCGFFRPLRILTHEAPGMVLDPRICSVGEIIKLVVGLVRYPASSLINSNNKSTAFAPISPVGCATVVRGGTQETGLFRCHQSRQSKNLAESDNLTQERSPGTHRDNIVGREKRCRARIFLQELGDP